MVPEAPLEETEHGLVPKGEGWFVVNARDARWYHAPSRSAVTVFEGDVDFEQLGINVSVLNPGQPMAMYHWEVDQEDFLVVSGEAVLIIEGEERPLRAWDFVHCPSRTKHTIVGAGGGPCVVVSVGGRVPGRRGGRAARRQRREGDERAARGVCPLPAARADPLRRLAAGIRTGLVGPLLLP
jgi:uncharacterized cupin superfamily protein